MFKTSELNKKFIKSKVMFQKVAVHPYLTLFQIDTLILDLSDYLKTNSQ